MSAEWVAAACAVLSVFGAFVAWWRSNLSAAAKADAELAKQQADETLAEIRRQADALQAMAEAAQGPVLWLEWDSHDVLLLMSRADLELVVSEDMADRRGNFVFDLNDLADGVVSVAKGRPVRIFFRVSRGHRTSTALTVEVLGQGVKHIPLPPQRPDRDAK